MKKSIVLLMVAALLVSVSTFAQENKKEAPKAQTEQVEKKTSEEKAGKEEKACCKEKGKDAKSCPKEAGKETKSGDKK